MKKEKEKIETKYGNFYLDPELGKRFEAFKTGQVCIENLFLTDEEGKLIYIVSNYQEEEDNHWYHIFWSMRSYKMEIADWYYCISGHYREGLCVDLDDCKEGIESYRPDTHIQITNKEIIKELNKIKYGE